MDHKEAPQKRNGFEPNTYVKGQVLTAHDMIMGNQRRVSPRLKCIYESKQLHYGTSRRDSSQWDKKCQETANVNHLIQKTPPIVSAEKKADRGATQNTVSNGFEPKNGSNVWVPMKSNQSLNNQGSSVQKRVSPRLKNISASERPYYEVARRSTQQPSREDKNLEIVNGDHLIPKSSPIVSRKRDADKGCTSELDHLEPKDFPNVIRGNVRNQGCRSDLTVFNAPASSDASAHGSIDTKALDPKWLDGCNISANADWKSGDAMVKETLRVYNSHYHHFVGVQGHLRKALRPRSKAMRRFERRYSVHFTRSHGLKSSSKLSWLVSKDISGGQEDISIPATNSIDDTPIAPPGFIYSDSIQVVDDINLPPNAEGCSCKGNCTNPKACACARLNGTDFPYVREKGDRLIEAKDVVFECGPNCCCGPDCINRTSQRGIKFQLEVFRTPKKGWAVWSRDFIPSGAPVCEYTGVLRRTDELDNVSENDYIFEIDCLQTIKEVGGREKRLGDASMPINNQLEKIDDKSVDSTPEFCIDAGSVGNVARFINHSCDPNLFVQCVLSTHHDARFARVVLFAADDIAPFQELTYDYGYALDSVVSPDGKVKLQPCHCGAADCRKRLY